MHKFLRAAGFSQCRTKREEEALLNTLMRNASAVNRLALAEDTTYAEYRCELAPGLGISLV